MTTKDELIARRDELLAAAFDGVMDTLGDPHAPPTSKASATQSALRLYEQLAAENGSGKQAYEMSAEEIQAEIRRLKRIGQNEEVDED